MPKLLSDLKAIQNMSVEIGIFGSDDSFYAMIANVHEFGMVIRPKGKYLTVPTKENAGRSPADIPGLFKPKGKRVLATSAGKGAIKVEFYLMESVNIPERSFVRSTADEKTGDWNTFAHEQLRMLVKQQITPRDVFERIGQRVQADIQAKITSISSPPNSPATIAAKGSSNPLIDTGGLRARVTYKVVGG